VKNFMNRKKGTDLPDTPTSRAEVRRQREGLYLQSARDLPSLARQGLLQGEAD